MSAWEVSSGSSRVDPHPRTTLVVVLVASVLSSMDLFIVNLAFPSIRDSFPGSSNQTLAWVLSAYSIAFAAALAPSGRMADRFGRKRIFTAGLAIFAAASLVCAIAPDIVTIIVARAVKGIGSALLIPSSLALLLAAYPKEKHTQVVAMWAAAGSVAAALGPALGGLLIHFDWRWIFMINLPFALPALWLTRYMPETDKVDADTPDLIGSACLAAGIACAVATISYVGDWGPLSARFLLFSAAAVALLVVFVRRSLTVANPAIDLTLFRTRGFTVSAIGMAVFYVGFAFMLLGGTLYLTQVWHWDPILAGAGFGLGPACAVLSAVVGGRAGLPPYRLAVIGGLFFVAAGIWWLSALGDEPHFAFAFLPGLVLSGLGAGVAQAGFIANGTAALPPSQYGTGSGVLNTARQIGAALGVSLLVAVTGPANRHEDFTMAWVLLAVCGVLTAYTAYASRAPLGADAKRSPV